MLLFNIQRFSTHDGNGIRTTVFFKGCPLGCLWCHNPESQSEKKQVLHNAERCVLCGKCVSNCPKGAISLWEGVLTTDEERCIGCGICADECFNCAREIAGQEYTTAQVLDVIKRDKTFYAESGGGVTFSGGECLMYPQELTELLKECRQIGIHTAVDTCGFAPWESIEKTLPYTSIYLYDIKCMDPQRHKRLTGADNKLILKNLRLLKENGADIWFRLPLIEGANCDEENILATLALAQEIRPSEVSLLAYHNTGSFKYSRLGRSAEKFSAPTQERLEYIKALFEGKGFEVKIGG